MTDKELHELRSEAAGLIRRHLWLDGKPPTFQGERRPWSMGRELNIWNTLVRSGYRPDELNAAIAVAREVKRTESGAFYPWEGRSLSMRIFYWKNVEGFNATPFLNVCIGVSHKRLTDDRRTKKLPPTVAATLRSMI